MKEKASVELALAQGRMNKVTQSIEEHKEEISKTNDDLEKGLRKKISSNEIANYSEFINALQIKIEIKKMELVKAEQAVFEKRKNLIEKTRQCKIFEKLKERDFKKWNLIQNQKEMKQINEAAIIRHGKDFL